LRDLAVQKQDQIDRQEISSRISSSHEEDIADDSSSDDDDSFKRLRLSQQKSNSPLQSTQPYNLDLLADNNNVKEGKKASLAQVPEHVQIIRDIIEKQPDIQQSMYKIRILFKKALRGNGLGNPYSDHEIKAYIYSCSSAYIQKRQYAIGRSDTREGEIIREVVEENLSVNKKELYKILLGRFNSENLKNPFGRQQIKTYFDGKRRRDQKLKTRASSSGSVE
jgi:hypothetical protein